MNLQKKNKIKLKSRRQSMSDAKVLERAINNKTTKSCWDNIHELRNRATDEIFFSSLKLIKSKNIKKKLTGIDILAQFGVPKRTKSKEVVSLFLYMLDEESDPSILNSLLVGLGHNETAVDRIAIEIISKFKNHKDSYVRFGLVRALLGKSYSIAIDTLIFLSKDKSKPVKDWATFGLGSQIDKNTKKIRNALWERINDKDQNNRMEAIVGLAKRKDLRIKEIIIKELQNEDYGTLLFEAIQEIGDKDFIKPLETELSESKKDISINSEWIQDLEKCIRGLKENIVRSK